MCEREVEYFESKLQFCECYIFNNVCHIKRKAKFSIFNGIPFYCMVGYKNILLGSCVFKGYEGSTLGPESQPCTHSTLHPHQSFMNNALDFLFN